MYVVCVVHVYEVCDVICGVMCVVQCVRLLFSPLPIPLALPLPQAAVGPPLWALWLGPATWWLSVARQPGGSPRLWLGTSSSRVCPCPPVFLSCLYSPQLLCFILPPSSPISVPKACGFSLGSPTFQAQMGVAAPKVDCPWGGVRMKGMITGGCRRTL